jgi:hypothetical protein
MMLVRRVRRMIRVAAMSTALFTSGSLLLWGCGLSDIRDSAVDGGLSAVQGAVNNWVGALLINLNEFIDPFPDNAVVPTP